MSDPLISIRNLSYTYPNSSQPALKNVNLDVAKGSCTLIVGQSGCGKSTLARCLNGLIPHLFRGKLEGQLTVEDKDTSTIPVWELANHVGLVFQNTESQLFTLTVEDEVSFGPENFGIPRREIRERVDWALDALDISNLSSCSIFKLSDGQKQRVVIAANLSSLPEILVFDEPTSNLDPKGKQEFIELVKELRGKWKKTIILIDHYLQGMMDCFDSVVIMEDGEIKLTGATDILMDGDIIERFCLRRSSWIFSQAISAMHVSDSNRKIDHDMLKDTAEPVIFAEGLCFSYGKIPVFKKISFGIEAGEIVGIVGKNGGGKTTLLKLIAGLLKPLSGRIVVSGTDTRNVGVSQLARKAALVLQNPDHQLFASSVYEDVAFSIESTENHFSGRSAIIEEVLREMDLWDLRHHHPHRLSEGQKQRVTIAVALARQPEILVLDEPTTGMDGKHLDMLRAKIRKLNAFGITVVIASHDSELILSLCHRTFLIEYGKMIQI